MQMKFKRFFKALYDALKDDTDYDLENVVKTRKIRHEAEMMADQKRYANEVSRRENIKAGRISR